MYLGNKNLVTLSREFMIFCDIFFIFKSINYSIEERGKGKRYLHRRGRRARRSAVHTCLGLPDLISINSFRIQETFFYALGAPLNLKLL